MKKTLKLALASAFGALMVFVGCSKDFTQDIQALGDRVSALESKVNALQAAIDKGAVITSVTPVLDSAEGGIKITLSNGESYVITNGKNGANGANGAKGDKGDKGDTGATGAAGAPGSVVTIGANGHWFIDGKDTGIVAKGQDGKDGAQGAQGNPGAPGKDGQDGKDGVDGKDGKDGVDGKDGKDGTVVTIGENGNWFLDGKDTGIAAKSNVWAKVEGSVLTISVDGKEYKINLSAQLSGLLANYEYVRGVNNFKYFYTEDNGSQFNMACYDYMLQAKGVDSKGAYTVDTYVGSNPTAFTYKLNPSNADVAAYDWSFNAIEWNSVQVGTKVLAGGDKKVYTDAIKVLSAEKYAKDPSNVTVKTVLFPKPIAVSAAPNFKAFNYPHARFELVATDKASAAIIASEDEEFGFETVVSSYDIVPAIPACQNPSSAAAVLKYSKEYIAIADACPCVDEFNYKKTLDLNTIVDLYSSQIDWKNYKGLVKNLGRDDVKFAFELAGKSGNNVTYGPKAVYLGLDGVTNQNEYVEIDANGVIKVKEAYQESSVNREPLVHAVAYTEIDGKTYRFAEAFFRVKVTKEDPTPSLPNYLKLTDRFAHFSADKLTSTYTSKGTVAPVSELKVTFDEFSKEALDVLHLSYAEFLAEYLTDDVYVITLDSKGEKVSATKIYSAGTDSGYNGAQAIVTVPAEPKTSTTIGEFQINEAISLYPSGAKVYGKEQKVILGFKHAKQDAYIGMEFRFLVDEPSPAPAHNFVIEKSVLNPDYLIDQDVNKLFFGTVAKPIEKFVPENNKNVAGVKVKGIGTELTSSVLEHFREYNIATLEAGAYLEFTILNFSKDSYVFANPTKPSTIDYTDAISTVWLDANGNETTKAADKKIEVSKVKMTKEILDQIQKASDPNYTNAPEIRYIGSALTETQNVLVKVTEVCTSAKCAASPKAKSGVYYVQFGTQFVIKAATIELATLKTETSELIAKHIVIADKSGVELFKYSEADQKFVPTPAAKAAPYYFDETTPVVIKGTPELKYYAKDSKASFGGNLWISDTANDASVKWFNDGTDLDQDKYAYINVAVSIDNKYVASPAAPATEAVKDTTSVKVKVLKTVK